MKVRPLHRGQVLTSGVGSLMWHSSDARTASRSPHTCRGSCWHLEPCRPTGGLVMVRPGEVRPVEVRPGEVRPGEVRPGEVRPGEVRPGEVAPPGSIREVDPAE